MYLFYKPMYDAVHILTESTSRKEESEIELILEDSTSPITTKYVEKLYDSVMSKSHIDFDNIPDSKGDIVQYVGYTNMIAVLENIQKLASDSGANDVIGYVEIIKTAIANMRALAPIYQKGFALKNSYIMLEYNTFVYTIIQAVSAILYEFVDYYKRPDSPYVKINIANNKYRANIYYIEQLNKFNKICADHSYSKYLNTVINNGKNNFTGIELIGLGTLVGIALSIVPIMRELIYQFYHIKSNISDALAQQAYFLELNKSVIEARSDLNAKKKDQILIKQEKIKNKCARLSEKLRVNHVNAMKIGKAAIANDNKLLTINNLKDEVNNSPLQLL